MAWKTSYYHFDAVGSTRLLTDTNQSVRASYRQTGFGEQLTSSNSVINPFRFVGQLGYYFDAATALFNVRQRVYDATIGRWLSQDPAQSDHNLFRYATNSPLQIVDPTGFYGTAGHFWTTYIVARSTGKFDPEQAFHLAYYSQYPDQDPKYSAIGALKIGRRWSQKVYNWIHSLHGGHSAQVETRRDVLADLIKDPKLEEWQRGVIIHALGDAYAHVMHHVYGAGSGLGDVDEEAYGWPFGHSTLISGNIARIVFGYPDEIGHRTDYIPSDRANYKSYVDVLYSALGGKSDQDSRKKLKRLFDAIQELPDEYSAKNADAESTKLRELARADFDYTFAYVPTDDENRIKGNPDLQDIDVGKMVDLMRLIEESDNARRRKYEFR